MRGAACSPGAVHPHRYGHAWSLIFPIRCSPANPTTSSRRISSLRPFFLRIGCLPLWHLPYLAMWSDRGIDHRAPNRASIGRAFLISSCAARSTQIPQLAGPQKQVGPPQWGGPTLVYVGGVLLSRGPAAQVPSALTGLTSVFGMGTGGTLSPWPPKHLERSLSTP